MRRTRQRRGTRRQLSAHPGQTLEQKSRGIRLSSGTRAEEAAPKTFCPMEDTRYPFMPHTAVTGPLASSRQSSLSLYHRLLLEFGSGTTSTTSKIYVCTFTLWAYSNNALPGKITPTAPLTARSSPLLIVVPTAMKSFVPDSVLEVSNVTISRALTNSLGENSYLQNQKVGTEFWVQLTFED